MSISVLRNLSTSDCGSCLTGKDGCLLVYNRNGHSQLCLKQAIIALSSRPAIVSRLFVMHLRIHQIAAISRNPACLPEVNDTCHR